MPSFFDTLAGRWLAATATAARTLAARAVARLSVFLKPHTVSPDEFLHLARRYTPGHHKR